MPLHKPYTLNLPGVLEGFTATFYSSNKKSMSLLQTYLPFLIGKVMQSQRVDDLPERAVLAKCYSYSISLSSGTLCYLENSNIDEFLKELKEAHHDEGLMAEANLHGYHNCYLKC